jgi:nucleotide-binding universal stress UspA family protein
MHRDSVEEQGLEGQDLKDGRVRVLINTDGSDGAIAAGRFAAGLFAHGAAEVRLLTVVSGELYPCGPFGERLSDADDRIAAVRAEEEFACGELARLLRANGQTVTIKHRFGQPATEVMYEAAEWKPDLIVAGRRGRRRANSLVLGSVSERLLHHAQCPLLIVP